MKATTNQLLTLFAMLTLFGPALAGAEALDTTATGDGMKLKTDNERKVTSVAGLGQELISAAVPELRVLYGEVHLRLASPLTNPQGEKLPPTFGGIRPAGAGQARLRKQETTWVSNHLAYDCAASPDGQPLSLNVHISRLTPAVVVQSSGSKLDLFVGMPRAEIPDRLAMGTAGQTERRQNAAGPIPQDCRWILLWRGKSTGGLGDRDLPLLIVPLTPIRSLESLNPGGLRLDFGTAQASVALLPLRGVVHPGASQTAAWLNAELPTDIQQDCNWWSEHVGAFPVDVTESFSYDPAADRADVKYNFRYLRLASSAKVAAPLPPMLALADQQGFAKASSPLELAFSGDAHDTHAPTIFGPYVAIDGQEQCSWSLRGLKRYVDFARKAGPSTEASKPFEDKLHAEVDRIVKAGVLAPWFYQDGCFDVNLIQRQLYWANPAEHVYFLTECMDLLPVDLRQAVAESLLKWPSPSSTSRIGLKTGQRREFYHMEDSFLDMKMRYENEPQKIPPAFNLYAVDRLIRATGRKLDEQASADCRRIMQEHLKLRDWPTLFWSSLDDEDMQGVVAANRDFAGMLGWIRLSRAGDDAGNEAIGFCQLARSATLRYAMGRYRQYLYDVGRLSMPANPDWQARASRDAFYGEMISFDCRQPDQDIEQVSDLDAFQVQTGTYHPIGDWRVAMRPYQIPFRFMVPELAEFLADTLKPQCARYEQVLDEFQPDWYLTWPESTVGTEHSANPPSDAYQNFLARAWVLHESPERLRKYLDVPQLAVGDYFYMHKLAEIARAYRSGDGK